MSRRQPPAPSRRVVLAAALAPAALTAPAIAQDRRLWRMATSWPKNLAGPGVSARRIAERVTAMSDGRLSIALFAAGELVPPFGVFDAVATGAVECGHSASVFWSGRARAAALFTSQPFGLTPWEHASWIAAGEGQAAWDALYGRFGLKAFLAGNTGPSLGGWFRREIETLDDLKGVTMRIAGLGGAVMQALGAAPVSVAPGEVAAALRTGAIDAAEFASPAADRALGLDRLGATAMTPGFHEPNGASEVSVNAAAWGALPADLKAILSAACGDEHARGLAEAERANAAALGAFAAAGTAVKPWPGPILDAARPIAEQLIAEVADDGPEAAAVVASWRAALSRARLVARETYTPFLAAREG